MSVLNEFREAIRIQQKKEDEEYLEEMKLPLDERVLKGITISNARVKFDFFDQAPNPWCPVLVRPSKFIRSARIYCENNISKFTVGATVILRNGRHTFKMEIVEDTVSNFILAPNDFNIKYCSIDSVNYSRNNWEINIVSSDLTLKLLSATAGNLESDSVRLGRIEKLLSGRLENATTSGFSYDQLNPSQNTAVERAIQSQNFHIIQGPPGTGKTKTIAHIAKILLKQGKKVFITAPTHTAINNCLNAISKEVKDPSKLVKIGEKYQASEILGNDYITRKTRLPKDTFLRISEFSKNGIIIGGTPYSMCYPASKRLNHWEFDVALIDEAAQMSIPLAVSVMSKSDKFIFVGDHKQLDPIMPSGTGNSMFSESVFSRLVRLYPSNQTLLNISYRLNPNLIRIPNDLFYKNELSSDSSLDTAREHIPSAKYSDALNHTDCKILYLHNEFDAKGRSPYEAKIVAEIVKDLLSSGVEYKEIGILTPYRAQVREIKKALSAVIRGIDTDETDSLFVDTVDRMQGQERNYIIYSMSDSHPLQSKRRLDFFYSPNRLNVAITRAIKKCIVIANYKVFDINEEELKEIPEFNELKPNLDIFKSYYKLSTKIEEQVEEDGW